MVVLGRSEEFIFLSADMVLDFEAKPSWDDEGAIALINYCVADKASFGALIEVEWASADVAR